MSLNAIPEIDYTEHPAFHDLPVTSGMDDAVVGELVGQIGVGLDTMVTSNVESSRDLAQVFAGSVRPRIATLSKYVCGKLQDRDLAVLVAGAVERTASELLDEANFNLKCRNFPNSPRLSESGERVAAELNKDGFSARAFDDKTRRILRGEAAPMLEELRIMAEANPFGRNVITLRRKMPIWQLIHNLVTELGFVEGVSTYCQFPMELAGGSVEYSHPGQKWWKGCYYDVGLDDAATTYLHIDYGYAVPKAMLMLSDADETNGASSFVPGSHRWTRSEFLSRLHRILDARFKAPSPRLHYHRERYMLPRFRRQQMLMPAAFRGSSHFGDDILDGTELSRQFLSLEQRITSDIGDIAVFDGGRTLHRGALVSSGYRLAAQLLFLPKEQPTLRQRTTRTVRKLARKVSRPFLN
jgi:ectoine hydroxylase-related dioxygenase (phytanoyl-CoA dioxygenase family)